MTAMTATTTRPRLRWWSTTTLLLVLLLLLACTTQAAAAAAKECELNESGECINDADAEECKDSTEECLQGATLGKCSGAGAEEFQQKCPKSCRVCYSCDDVKTECEGKKQVDDELVVDD